MKLSVDGAVLAPLELGFEELSALPGQIDDISSLVSGREGGGAVVVLLLLVFCFFFWFAFSQALWAESFAFAIYNNSL